MSTSLANGTIWLTDWFRRVATGKINPPNAKKPAALLFGIDDSPPVTVVLSNSIQQIAIIAVNLVYPIVVFRASNAPVDVTSGLLAVAMLILAFGTLMQALRLGPVGSGYMCPSTFTATYFASSLMAARTGGLPLVFGMTVFSGLFQAMLAPMLNRLRGVFPPEISGLVIFMIGWSAGIAGLRVLLSNEGPPVSPAEWSVVGATLGAMIAMNVWGDGLVRMTAALLGVVFGYVVAILLGVLDHAYFASVMEASWLGLPKFYFKWSFDPAFIAPFAIASVAAAMKAAGTITICQRINDASWVRPDLPSVTRGVLADGFTTVAAGLAGAVGTNTSTPGVGVAAASGVTSRIIAYCVGGIFLGVAFCPKLTALLAIMPRSIIVPALIFTVAYIIVNGVQIMTSRLLDARRTFVIGFSIISGSAVEVFPALVASAPTQLSPVLGSSLVFATVVALVLNSIFRIGVGKSASLVIDRRPPDSSNIEAFFLKQGAIWGARPDITHRASFGTIQLVDAIADNCWDEGSIVITVRFDEFSMDVEVSYIGKQLEFPSERPAVDLILDDENGVRLLAGYLLRQNADRIRSEHKHGRSLVFFHFDH